MTADREAMLRALVGATWCAPPTDEMWYAMRATMLEHPDEPDLWSTWVRTATGQLAAIEPLIAEREEAAREEERACIRAKLLATADNFDSFWNPVQSFDYHEIAERFRFAAEGICADAAIRARDKP